MISCKLCQLVSIMLLCVCDANAQSTDWKKCVDATKTNFEWSQCGVAEINREEERVGAAWRKAFACFADSAAMKIAKQKFLDEQRLWIKWKDASCNFYGEQEAFGREGSVLHFPQCRASVIIQRAEFLETFGKDCQ
jgi:uncharacterized protein YecT (DUF1311 family)